MRAEYELNGKDFNLKSRIGSGQSGQVYLAHHKDFQDVAIKKTLTLSNNHQREMQNNIYLLSHNVQNIVKWYGYYKESGSPFLSLVMELYDCTLAEKIRKTNCGFYHQKLTNMSPTKTNCYLLNYTYQPEQENLIYYNSKLDKINPIRIDKEVHSQLKKFSTSKNLNRLQLTTIEQITKHKLPQTEGLPSDQITDLILQIATTLEHFSRIEFVHADIKPSNIGLSFQNGLLSAKIGDFDLSFYKENRSLEAAGSPYYMAPEVINTRIPKEGGRQVVNSLSSDIYSFANLLWCILIGEQEFPYEELSRIKTLKDLYQHVVIQKNRESFPADYNNFDVKNLIEEGWHEDPLKRPSAEIFNQKLKTYFKKEVCLVESPVLKPTLDQEVQDLEKIKPSTSQFSFFNTPDPFGTNQIHNNNTGLRV